ncbi:iron permease FTR1 family-domain-containing protein [Gamsiella multidivaricata]|uniref:iron permease FTR1 family-domain-containing protein n=1 Tax=Gamsiella multidivaricata TaxID=101098 RepID=UPI002220F377|nr:iron permease FTR1 family-domain-containing protein [Gamsiella multidivaricata]KAG0364546.1 high-affinity iron permease [Gamsiella multidivaricata]KAI7816990.1 iron permease FTR1 family-domain-containing protein [Gamsiella multidivaricata]
MGSDYFSVPIFFIIFRETTEAAIIVSVLLSFLKQVITDDHAMRKRLSRQVWGGTILGLAISLAIGAAFIVIWNKYANNLWATSEGIWVGCFSFLAVAMITVMGLAMLRTTQIQEKWKVKLSKAMDEETERGLSNSSRRYALFVLPLITVLREGLEAIVFIGGVTFTETAKAIPAAVIVGVFCGLLVGYILYRGGNKMNLHKFFTASTCLLLLLAAGLVSKGVAAFESYAWTKATHAQSDDGGTYDPRINVWALSCCDPNNTSAGFAQLMNALFGWSNIASIGTIVCYIVYWLAVTIALIHMKLRRRRAAVRTALNEVPEDTMLEDRKDTHLINEITPESESSGSGSASLKEQNSGSDDRIQAVDHRQI